ncbi:MAG: HD domain-containing protein [Phascolarctobacterium sp.]|nr:HD domain-containing protein [Phascolarctobacterium sp.]
MNNETELLFRVLCFEEGHPRRTQHILKVYALAKLLGEKAKLSAQELQILQAAAILHDIAIKYCKEHFDGVCNQALQKQVAPMLVRQFLELADYSPEYIPVVTELVLKHHDYDAPKNKLLQFLMEADLIVNCYEAFPDEEKLTKIKTIFKSQAGKELFNLCVNE